MDQTSYTVSSHLNMPKESKDADLAAYPDHPCQRPFSCAIQFAIGKPWQCEKMQQDEGTGNRQGQQQKLDKLSHLLCCCKEAGRGRRQWQCREERFFNRHLTERDPSESFSNGCGRRGGQCKGTVHGPQCEQPREAYCQDHNWRRNQQQQGTELLLQEQAGEQSGRGQELQKARQHLRPMNMAGYFPSGMSAPHNTSQYIINQHEYSWRTEQLQEMAEGSTNHSTVDGDFPLVDSSLPWPRRMKAHQQQRKRKRLLSRLEMPRRYALCNLNQSDSTSKAFDS